MSGDKERRTKTRPFRRLLSVGVLLLSGTNVFCTGENVILDIGERWYAPTRAVETPHIEWANPRAGGKLRVLFLGEQSKMREVVELAQRLEMDYAFWGAGGRKGKDMFRCGVRVGWFKGDAPGDKLKRLEVLLRDDADYDLIVMGEFQWHGLPLFARYQILKRVKNGTGLVRVYTGKGCSGDEFYARARDQKTEIPAEAMAGVPWKALPVFADYADTAALLNGTLNASRFGKGTIVEIVGYKVPDAQLVTPGFTRDPLTLIWYRNWAVMDHDKYPDYDMPITHVKFLDYDYYAAWFIKVMLFAAGQQADVTVSGDGVVREVARNEFSQAAFTVTVPDTPDLPFLTADFTLRDRDNNVLATDRKDKLDLKPGENIVSFPVANIPGGSYFADLWVRRDGETMGFGSVALIVKSSPAIKALTLDSGHFSKAQTITGRIEIGESQRADLKLEIRQEDNFGRLVRAEMIPVTDAEMALALAPIPAPASVYQHVIVDLVRGKEKLDRKRVSFTYSDLYVTNTIHTTVWQWPQISYLSLRRHEQLYEAGFDSSLECHIGDIARHDYYGLGPRSTFKNGRFEIPVLANLRYVPPVTRIADMAVIITPDKQGVARNAFLGLRGEDPIKIEAGIRTPCVNDPKYIRMLTRRMREVVEYYRTASSSEYLIDQETSYTQSWHRRGKYGHLGDTGEVCFCPHCRTYFQDYLKKEYGTIAAVNEEYGTAYKDFNEVQPVSMEEAVEDGALTPRWIDFRMSQDSAYSGMYAKVEKTVMATQPNGRMGDLAPIAFGFRTGEAADMWKMSRWRRWYHPYPRLSGQMHMDFALPGSMISDGEYLLSSHSRSVQYLSRKPWESLFLGCRYYNCYFGMRGGTLIGHDYSVYDDVDALLAQHREIKSGIGKLLIESERFNGNVAMLYSIASVHKWTLRPRDIVSTEMSDNVSAWCALLTDGHGPYKFISYAQLADGVLSREKFGLLILPWCQALSPAEVDAVKSFVKDGGTVLADLRPGVSDGHGKPYGASPLDEVFGVVHNTAQPAIKQGIVTVPRAESAAPEFFGMMLADASLKPGTGRAMGSVDGTVPAFVVNRYGKGKGILLNFSLNGYYVRQNHYTAIPGARPQNAADVLSFFKFIMAQVELDRPITIEPHVKDLRYHMLTSGETRYLGLWQEFPEPLLNYAAGTAAPLNESKAILSFKTSAHIYDAREKRYLGYADRVAAYFRPDRPKVLSLLPYRVTGIRVTAPAVVRQGEPVAYAAVVEATAQPGKHVLRVELVGPGGETPRYYARNVGCEDGTCTGVWHLALDETPGAYRLVVTDAATGKEGSAEIVVEERRASK